MVLQRWQTVFLLIGAVLMVLFSFLPFAEASNGIAVAGIEPCNYPVFFVLNIFIAVLMLVTIFMFKNLKLQKMLTKVLCVLIAGSAISAALIIHGSNDKGVEMSADIVSVVLLVVSFLMCVAAFRGIRHDQKVLSNYDRLR